MLIRKARLADAQGIANVHVDTWRTTYEGIIPTEFLNKLDYSERKNRWENKMRTENVVFVVENEEGQIIGFADTSRRENNLELNSIDLTSLYLLEAYQGRGIGKLLMKTLFEHYKNQSYDKVYVDVLADNNTRYFYEYLGAKFVRNIKIKIGGKILDESTYVWESVNDVLEKLEINASL